MWGIDKWTNKQVKTAVLNELKHVGLDWLANELEFQTDFFDAPASTKYHSSKPGGLARHSYNVFKHLEHINESCNLQYSKKEIAIAGLLHDLCKLNYYVPCAHGFKVFNGLPLDHGSKSVILLIEMGLPLNRALKLAIAHHMGAWHCKGIYEFEQNHRKAIEECPLVLALQTADQRSTHWDKI